MGFGGTSPCAQTKGEKVFLDRHPEDMLKDGDFAPKDIVFGANKAEGSFVLGGMISYIIFFFSVLSNMKSDPGTSSLNNFHRVIGIGLT